MVFSPLLPAELHVLQGYKVWEKAVNQKGAQLLLLEQTFSINLKSLITPSFNKGSASVIFCSSSHWIDTNICQDHVLQQTHLKILVLNCSPVKTKRVGERVLNHCGRTRTLCSLSDWCTGWRCCTSKVHLTLEWRKQLWQQKNELMSKKTLELLFSPFWGLQWQCVLPSKGVFCMGKYHALSCHDICKSTAACLTHQPQSLRLPPVPLASPLSHQHLPWFPDALGLKRQFLCLRFTNRNTEHFLPNFLHFMFQHKLWTPCQPPGLRSLPSIVHHSPQKTWKCLCLPEAEAF